MIRVILKNREIKIGSNLNGGRWDDHTYYKGSGVFVLPLACGKKQIGKYRLRHYGKFGYIVSVSGNLLSIQTPTEKITGVRIDDIVSFPKADRKV